MRSYNIDARGSNLTKLFHVTWHGAGMIIWYNFLGACTPYNLGGQKPSKIRHDFQQLLALIANISRTDEDIVNQKSKWSTTIPPTFDEKNWWRLFHNKKKCVYLPPPSQFFLEDYISAPRWSCPLKFSHMVQNSQSLLTDTYRRRGSLQHFFRMINSKICPKFSMCVHL